VRFKIKLEENLPVGSSITNTAHIYFDFNPAVVTNTTLNTITVPFQKPLITASSASACMGDTVTLQTVANALYTYQWLFNGGGIANSNSPTWQVTQTGSYSVSVTDGTDAEVSDPLLVTINALPNVSLASTANSVCADGGALTLTASPSGGTYSGAVVSGNSFDPADNATGLNTIVYAYTDANGCADSAATSITVNALPQPEFSLPTAPFCKADALEDLTDYVNLTGGTFSGDVVTSAGVFDLGSAGNYAIAYTYMDGNGCEATAQATVVVDECIGIGEVSVPVFNIYPNPASTQLTIIADAQWQGATIIMYDMTGRVMLQETAIGQILVLNTTGLANGMYMVVIADTHQHIMFRSRVAVAQ
jgi:hypothetical protein